ncbi:alpha/beta hydrolase [Pedobacter duraquae]|uniref:AB hydrolase-1 domain-containing protein n=1 Tax=Pedobacter duraquae TaxID=425511 RepID=A0A4R6IGB1_9SPHI|nr:alpha/beta hydrolase [Pedobacter duraquae]TDO20707.1 hypothetical protein CLV32_3340 [Pedobacter duraquae]
MTGKLEDKRSRIYMISGLGADRRAFRKLVFPDEFEVVYLDWISEVRNESLADYAGRLALNIDSTVPFYLIGLSFGGMLATEISKILKPLHTFLISSLPVYSGLPWYYKLSGLLRLQKALPLSVIKNSNTFGLRFLGATTADGKKLLKQLVADSNPAFIKWALTAILTWRNEVRPENLTHIHGNTDFILPSRYLKPDVTIINGGHFMVYVNAEEIRTIILDKIQSKIVL